jgi:hypothetical protein
MTIKYKTLDSSEIDDFRKSCKKYSVNYTEFKLEEHEVNQIQTNDGFYYYKGKVTISKNNKSKTYNTGRGSKWPAEFDIDLKNGAFK